MNHYKAGDIVEHKTENGVYRLVESYSLHGCWVCDLIDVTSDKQFSVYQKLAAHSKNPVLLVTETNMIPRTVNAEINYIKLEE